MFLLNSYVLDLSRAYHFKCRISSTAWHSCRFDVSTINAVVSYSNLNSRIFVAAHIIHFFIRPISSYPSGFHGATAEINDVICLLKLLPMCISGTNHFPFTVLSPSQ